MKARARKVSTLTILIAFGLVMSVGGALIWAEASRPPNDATRCHPSGATRLLALDFKEFDQTPGEGWRESEGSFGCARETAELIRRYRSQHADLPIADRAGLAWHEAQHIALDGQAQQAAQLIKDAAIFEGEPGWSRLHKAATFAFLRGDLEGVEEAEAAFAALPASEQGPPVHLTGAISNLDRVRGLKACFGKTYAVAYACTGGPIDY